MMNKAEHDAYTIKRTRNICFISLVLIHLCDMLSTIIGMSLGLVESNPITAYLFTFGAIGYLYGTIWALSIFAISFYFIGLLPLIYRNITHQEAPLVLILASYIIFSATLFIGLFWTVVNNILLILSFF